MNTLQHPPRPDDEPVSRGQRKTRQAAAAREQRRQAALHAHERAAGRRAFAEVGIEQAVVSNWWGLAAPAKTDAAIIARLDSALQKVLADPDIQKKLEEQGFVVSAGSAQQFKDELKKEAVYWQDVIKRSGAKLN